MLEELKRCLKREIEIAGEAEAAGSDGPSQENQGNRNRNGWI